MGLLIRNALFSVGLGHTQVHVDSFIKLLHNITRSCQLEIMVLLGERRQSDLGNKHTGICSPLVTTATLTSKEELKLTRTEASTGRCVIQLFGDRWWFQHGERVMICFVCFCCREEKAEGSQREGRTGKGEPHLLESGSALTIEQGVSTLQNLRPTSDC